MLVGLWLNSPVVGSGVGECYRFYDDGTYVFSPSDFVLDPEAYRPPSSEGRVQVDNDYVVLLMTQRTVLEGGVWVEDPITGYALEGAQARIETLPEPKTIHAQYLGIFVDLPKEMFSIDGRTYWKTSGDPNAYLD